MCDYREVTIKSIEDIKTDNITDIRKIWKDNCTEINCSNTDEKKCPRSVFLWILGYVTTLNPSISKNIKINTENGIHTFNILNEVKKNQKLLDLKDIDLWAKIIPKIKYNNQVEVIRVFVEQKYIDFDKLSKLVFK